MMDDIFTTGEKISLKSTPFFYLKPFTTNFALYLGSVEFESCFTLKIHLVSNALLPLGNFVRPTKFK